MRAIFLSLNILEIIIDINKILTRDSPNNRTIKVIPINVDFIISTSSFETIILFVL